MKTLIDVLAALSDFVKVASEWAESASKAEVETFTQIYPQKEEAVKKAVVHRDGKIVFVLKDGTELVQEI